MEHGGGAEAQAGRQQQQPNAGVQTAGGGTSTEQANFPLIASKGCVVVGQILSEQAPKKALQQVQAIAGLQQPLCMPLIGMLDQQHIPRHDAYRSILLSAKKQLISLVQQVCALLLMHFTAPA
jgi:hypothetical protein